MSFVSLEKQAAQLLKQKKYSKARTKYTRLADKFPSKYHGSVGLARVAMETQQWELALEKWNKVINSFPELIIGYEGKGNTLLELNKTEAANALFESIIEQFSDRHHGWTGLARVAIKTNQWELAFQKLNQAIKKFPKVVEIYEEKANLLLQLRKFGAATIVFEQIIERFPEQSAGWHGLARIAMSVEKWELALQRLNQAIEKFPDIANSYVEKANLLMQLEKFEAAEITFEKIAELFAQLSEGWTGLALVAISAEKWELALQRLNQAIEKFPKIVSNYVRKGNVLVQLGQHELATAVFEDLRQTFPKKHQGYFGLARIALMREEWTLGLTILDEITAKFPHIVDGHVKKANVLVQLGEFKSATVIFEQVIQNFPEQHEGWIGLTNIAIATEEWELALNRSNKTIEKFPDIVDNYLQKVTVLIQLEKFSEAELIIHDLYLSEPNNVDLLEKLTFIALYTGNWQEFKNKWNNFIQINHEIFLNVDTNYRLMNKISRSISLLLKNKKIAESEYIISSLEKYLTSHKIIIWKSQLAREKGLHELSNQICQRSIVSYPEQKGELLYQLALNAWDDFEIDKVIELCKKICSIQDLSEKNKPLFYQALMLLSRTLVRIDRENDAILVLKKAIEVQKSYSAAYLLLIEIAYFYAHDYHQSLEICNLAISQGIWHQELFLHKAISLSALGKTKSALEVIDAYLNKVPSDKLAMMYKVQLLRDDRQYQASLKQLNEIYISGSFAPIQSTGKHQELNIPYLECSLEQKFVAENMISVIMTTYKRDELLSVAINSVLQQTHSNLELIIVDDASPDDTWEWLQKFAIRDSRIKLLQMPKNAGTYISKNEGMLYAEGKYIAFMDSDDWIHPQLLETQISILQKSPDVMAVTCGFFRIDQNSAVEFRPEAPLGQAHITICFKKDPVLKTIGFFDAVRTGADTEHWNRIVLKWGINSIKKIDYPLLISTRSSQSITGGGSLGFPWHGPGVIDYIYWVKQRKYHRTIVQNDNLDLYLPHPLDYRRFDVPEIMLP